MADMMCSSLLIEYPPDIWRWVGFGSAMHILSFVLVCFHCLTHRRPAVSSLLWMFLSWSLPLVGPILYLSIGIDQVPSKAFRKRQTDDRLLAERRAREDEALPLAYWRSVHEAVVDRPTSGIVCDLDRAMDAILPDHPLLDGNKVETLVTGDEAYPRMLAAIRGAKHHVHLQSFIIRRDEVGREFLDALAEKARQGVTVRVLYDRFGCAHASLTGFFLKYRRIPGLRLVGWTQANPLKRQFQVNLRNHRKLLVVDGRQAFLGGINLHRENKTWPGRPADRDYHFAVAGPMVQELQYTFMRDWYFMTDEDAELLLKEAHFPQLPTAGDVQMRLVNGGPASPTQAIPDVFFMTICAARKQALIVTPYFVPSADIIRALRAAALRGVNVSLVLPRKNNHFYAGLAGCALYEELLEAGVRIFLRSPPFIHGKALIVDDTVALVGTANIDIRSFRLNYETDLMVHNDGFVNELKRVILDDMGQSEELTLRGWRSRPMHHRLLENLALLLEPIL